MLHLILDQSGCNIFGQNISIPNLNWFNHHPCFVGIFTNQQICCTNELDQDMHQSKPVVYVYMGCSQVKILQFNLLFHSDQSECFIQASNTDLLFECFESLNLSKCCFIQLKFMVQCQNSKREETKYSTLGFLPKMGKMLATKLVLTFILFRL